MVLSVEGEVFLVGDVQHIIAFIISMHLLFRMVEGDAMAIKEEWK